MEKLNNKNVILPQDFVEFIRRNYERIEEIENKVEQFQNDPWNRNSLRYRNFQNLQYYKLFESVDSCFSEGDARKVISASIKPKLKRLDAAEDRIQIGIEYLETIKQEEPFEPDSDNFDAILKNFPLISISKDNQQEKQTKTQDLCNSPCLLVQGVHLAFSERQMDNLCKRYSNSFSHINKSRTINFAKKKKRLKRQDECITGIKKSLRIKIPQNERNELNEGWASEDDHEKKCDDDNIKGVKYSEEPSIGINTRNLQLTLPPLHSSVLTLLGQRLGPKPSPRNLLSLAQEPSISSGASRNKKLRRHGRNRNKSSNKGKLEEINNPGDRAGSEEVKKITTDEPHETEVSTFLPNLNELIDEGDGEFNECNEKLHKFSESRRALYHVLDDHLAGKHWNPKDMSNLDEEIGLLLEDFQKYQTKFKTNLIKMKEDYWLSFPRTWSRSSATFGVPYDTRSLKGMTSLNYLENFVTISEPRRHLYSLIFQRHRMISNPTGKHITLKTCKQALSEVLGRPFLEEEMIQLVKDYLGCNDRDIQILERPFHGISAFCERIYACYSLETHHECHICHNNPTKDKQRCHQDQKSHLEKADMAYLSIKVRQGQVGPHLSNLLRAIFDRD